MRRRPTIERIRTALAATGLQFAHYGWSPAPAAEYGVYAEDGAQDFLADGLHGEAGITGTIDYFTRDDSGAVQTTIQNALEGVCAWQLLSIQYEDDTGLIHYEWEFGLYGNS